MAQADTSTSRVPETVYGELAHGIIQVVEHKKAVENLQDSELLTQKILSCSSNLIYIYDLLEKRNIYANREVAVFLGYTSEQVQAMGSELFAYILHPDDAEAVAKHHARFADAPDNATYEVEYRMKRASGDWRWLRSRDTLFARTPEGIGSQILGTCEDISERKKTERALIESEAHYRLLTENMRDVIWTMDLNGRFTYVSPSSLQIRGYTAEEAMHQSISQMLTPDSAQMVGKELSHFLETGVLSSNNFELEQYCKDGSTNWVEVTVTILRDKNGKPSSLLGVSRDITERKKTAENLRQLNEVLEKIGESIDGGLAIIGKDYRVVWANKRLKDLCLDSNKKCYQTFNTLDTVCPDCGVRKVFEQNVPADVHEFKTVDSEGETFWVELRVTPIKNKDGNVIAALELAVPITERKKIEEKMTRTLYQLSLVNEKLNVVGSLTRHDVKNKLSVVTGYAYLLKKKHQDQPDIVDKLSKIEQAVLDSTRLFEFSKMYEQIGVNELTNLDVGLAVDEAVALYKGLEFEIINDCHGRSVLADSFLTDVLQLY